MTRASDIAIESPYAPGREFGRVIEAPIETEVIQFADGVTVAVSADFREERDPRWYGIGVPQYVDEARAAAKGPATPSGVANFVPPAVKPIAEKALERAEDTMGAALDRLMRSVRLDEDARPVPPKLAAIVPLPIVEDADETPEKAAEEASS